MNISKLEDIEVNRIEDDFFEGRPDLLKGRMCPICKTGKLLFSVSTRLVNSDAEPGRRYKGSVNSYCTGKCNTMLTHVQGYIPAWAEGIEDWDKFSESLYEDS